MRYGIDYYKTDDLTPDERNAKRAGAKGLWLYAGVVEASDKRAALATARRLMAAGRLFGQTGAKVRINITT